MKYDRESSEIDDTIIPLLERLDLTHAPMLVEMHMFGLNAFDYALPLARLRNMDIQINIMSQDSWDSFCTYVLHHPNLTDLDLSVNGRGRFPDIPSSYLLTAEGLLRFQLKGSEEQCARILGAAQFFNLTSLHLVIGKTREYGDFPLPSFPNLRIFRLGFKSWTRFIERLLANPLPPLEELWIEPRHSCDVTPVTLSQLPRVPLPQAKVLKFSFGSPQPSGDLCSQELSLTTCLGCI